MTTNDATARDSEARNALVEEIAATGRATIAKRTIQIGGDMRDGYSEVVKQVYEDIYRLDDADILAHPIVQRLLADRAEESQLLLDEANRQIVQLRNAFGKYVADRAVPEPEPEPEPDAIERAAKAIAEMYPPRDNKHDGYVKPVWDMADIEDLAEHALKAAGDASDVDYTLVYMKGWQDGQDDMRKSVDAAVDSASRKEANDE